MELTELVKVIAEIGFPIVCAAVVIYLFIQSHKKSDERMDVLFDTIMNKSSISHQTTKEEMHVLEAVNNKIYQESNLLLRAINADRVYIFLYHNGGVSISGLSFSKMSCICEVVGQGILSLANERQNLHRASYARVCERLAREGFVAAPTTEYLAQLDSFLYNESLERRSYSSYFDALRDVSGMVIGALCVDFCSPHPDVSESFIKEKIIFSGISLIK